MTRVLITGGNGFIGSHLAAALVDGNHEVTTFGRQRSTKCDPLWLEGSGSALRTSNANHIVGEMNDANALQKALAGQEVVFHKTTVYSADGNSEAEIFAQNVDATNCFVRSLANGDSDVRHVIFDSSISVYGEGYYHCVHCGAVRPQARTGQNLAGDVRFEPVCPNCRGELVPIETSEDAELFGSSAYARSKSEQERILLQAAQEHGFRLTILRYATVYGPGQKSTVFYEHLRRAILKGEPVKLNEDGHQKRDFVYVQDVVQANLKAMELTHNRPLILNIGTEMETSLLDFVQTMINCAVTINGATPSEIHLSQRMMPGDIRHCRISCRAAREILDFYPAITVRSGIRRLMMPSKNSPDDSAMSSLCATTTSE